VSLRTGALLATWLASGISAQEAVSPVDADRSWGNVAGRVADAWARPVAGTEVRLVWSQGSRLTRTDDAGAFLFSGLGIPAQGDSGTISFALEGHPPLRLAIPPGAVLAPRVSSLPGSTTLTESVFPVAGPVVPVAARAAASAVPWAGPWDVFATREGLVGYTTANGHVIKVSDLFVALPSRRALNTSETSRDFLVELTAAGRTTVVPVLDVGPWNTKDDWWHDTLRESFRDLPRGLPQAMAAFRDGHNGGLDGSGRKALNGAGIDLADGVFWNDLGMVNNAQIQVRLLWKLTAATGDRVRLRQWANVRDAAAGAPLFKAECGEGGTISGPPAAGVASGHWYLYWPVAWDRGALGWVVENYLAREAEAPDCSNAARGAARQDPVRAGRSVLEFDAPSSGAGRLERLSPDGRILSSSAVRWTEGRNSLPLPSASGPEIVRLRGVGFELRTGRIVP